jgi:hypothetical protein
MAEILDIQTVGNLQILATDINPNLGTPLGTDAPIGSIAMASDGSGTYTKTGALDTDWTEGSGVDNTSGDVELEFSNSYIQNGIASVTILSLLVTNANFKSFSYLAKPNTDHDLIDFVAEGVVFSIQNIQDNVSFDIVASAPRGTWGKYKITYKIII